MRLKEILSEDYTAELSNDVSNVLVSAKASGIYEIDPDVLVRQLQNMGYSVTVDSLITLLQDNPEVMNASPDGIRMTGGDTSPIETDNTEDSKSHVDKMAQAAAQKGLK